MAISFHGIVHGLWRRRGSLCDTCHYNIYCRWIGGRRYYTFLGFGSTTRVPNMGILGDLESKRAIFRHDTRRRQFLRSLCRARVSFCPVSFVDIIVLLLLAVVYLDEFAFVVDLVITCRR